MSDAPEPQGGLLDAKKSKAVFVLGVALYLLMTFWAQAPIYSVAEMASKGSRLDLHKAQELDAPISPTEPSKPPEKAKDIGDLNNRYDKLKKAYDEKKKEYDEKLYPAYQREQWIYVVEEEPEIREELKELRKDYEWANATTTRWAYWAFVGRFIGAVLMLIGLGFTAVHGSEWERAAAIVVIGLVLVGTSGVIGNMDPGLTRSLMK
ncbi:MAG: hypothetical protein HUU15_15935 [Candidatus Brocadiae bacterium]|nr:hypothetical protein [Candidatus Brocadiia bacterium]